MAYAISSSIPTTASRFALLQLESDTESEPEKGKSGQADGKSQASGGRSSANERRREKRRRKKEQKQIEASELTSEMFGADLEKALLLSKLEYEEHKKECENTEGTYPQSLTEVKREKRKNDQGKDKPLTVSLEDFQPDSNIDNVAKKHEESGMKDGKTELKLALEKKDAEIQQLKNIIIQRKVKYKEVKARNAQLLKMLQESEMKDKAEILLQVEELQIIKNELTLQVTTLHAALEQGRSKEKQLQAELTKYQMLKGCEPSGRVWKKDEPPKSKKRGEKHS